MTNTAWREISAKSGLPDAASPKIDDALHLYRGWQQAKRRIRPPSDTKDDDLRAFAKRLDWAAEHLSFAVSNPGAAVSLIGATTKASAPAALKYEEAKSTIEGWISQIEEVRAVTLRVERSIKGGRRGG